LIVGAVDTERLLKQQIMEPEHLMKALLEQKHELACGIYTNSCIDNTSVLQATYYFIISGQSKVLAVALKKHELNASQTPELVRVCHIGP
jgi:ATP-dependent Clp protease ATP-binding subunit ClpB